MSILVLDQDGQCELRRPYLNKFGDEAQLVSTVWVGHQDEIEFTRDEKEFLERCAAGRYRGLIISSNVAFGLDLLGRLRESQTTKDRPVTIL